MLAVRRPRLGSSIHRARAPLIRATLALLATGLVPWALSPTHADPPADSEPTGALSLADAGALALLRNPALRSFADELRAGEARKLQAALRPNPEASVELENVSGDLRGVSDAELTLSISQLLELGGKRQAERGVVEARLDEVHAEFELTKRAVLGEVAARYVEAALAGRVLALEDEAVRIAEEIRLAVDAKSRAGAVSPAEEARARVEVQHVRLRREEAAADLEISRRRLASLWGSLDPRFTELTTRLDSLFTPPPAGSPPAEELVAKLESSPELARAAAGVQLRRRELRLAETAARPDLTLEAGVRRLGERDAVTFLVGASMELPLRDRNQGGIAEARAGIDLAQLQLEGVRVAQSLALRERLITIDRTRAVVQSLRREMLPAAERVYEEIRLGYERGRFTYVDLLEARRAWTEARFDELNALRAHHQARIEAEQILGGPLAPAAGILPTENEEEPKP